MIEGSNHNENRFKMRAWDMLDHVMRYNIGFSINGVQEYANNDKYPEELILDRGKALFMLMQCTGLKDKNSKLIYEGDIVKMQQMQGIGELTGYVVYSDDGRFDPRYWVKIGEDNVFFHNEPKVIGNIYENPELLKQTL